MVTAQMRREGEGECNRLIMWLVALRLRERERTKRKRQTQTERHEESGKTSEGCKREKTWIVFPSFPSRSRSSAGPGLRQGESAAAVKTPTPTINGKGKQPCQFVTWLAAATRIPALLQAANSLLTSPQGDEVRSVCVAALAYSVCVRCQVHVCVCVLITVWACVCASGFSCFLYQIQVEYTQFISKSVMHACACV